MAIVAKFTRTLPSPTATIGGGFVFLLSDGWFTQADTGAAGSPIDGGTNSLLNGGGDLQVFSDAAATNRLPCHIITFVTGGSPLAQVKVRTSSYTAGDTITIGKDDTQTSQPVVGAAFGRNAVYEIGSNIYNLEEAVTGPFIDSSGNSDADPYDSALLTSVTSGFDKGIAFTSEYNSGIKAASSLTSYPYSIYTKVILGVDLGNKTIISIADSSQDSVLQGVRLSADNKLQLYSYNGGGTFVLATTASTFTGLNYLRLEFISENTAKLYVNGVLETTLNHNHNFLSGSLNNGIATIARQSPAGWSDSTIYQASFEPVERGQDHIASEYLNQSDPDNFGTSSEYVLVGGGLTALSKSFSAQFNLNQRKSNSFTATVALLQRLNKNYQGLMSFLSANQVNKAFSFELDLLQQQQNQVQLVADLLSRDSRAFSGELDLLKSFTKSHSSLFDLLNRESKSFTGALALLQRENKSYQGLISFLSANQVNKAFSFQFDLLAHKVLTHSGMVNFLGHDQLNFSAVLNLLNRQSKSFSGELDFYQQVNKSFIYSLDMLATGRASKSYSFELDFIGRLTKQYNSEITLLQRQGLSHQLALDLLDRVAKDFSAQFDLVNTQSKNFTVTLDTIGRVGKTFDVVFNIESDNTPKTPAHYVISVDHLIAFIDPPIQTIEFIDNPIQTLIV